MCSYFRWIVVCTDGVLFRTKFEYCEADLPNNRIMFVNDDGSQDVSGEAWTDVRQLVLMPGSQARFDDVMGVCRLCHHGCAELASQCPVCTPFLRPGMFRV